MALTIFILVLLLAWVNGANDAAKGVATLAGSGVSSARWAIVWATLCTVLGGLAAALWGGELISVFSKGFLSAGFPLSLSFVGAVIVGALGWIAIATHFGMPVSTTHALLGGIVGAALTVSGPDGLHAAAVAHQALLPLLLSPLIALLLCWFFLFIAKSVEKKVPAWRPGCCEQAQWQKDPFICATPSESTPSWQRRAWTGLHWLSAGTTSFARGLNDVPKITAFLVLVIALHPQIFWPANQAGVVWLVVLVSFAMGIGGLLGGLRILKVLAHRVTPMNTLNGLTANLSTTLLVLAATPLGLPVSTTHVSTGALMGIRWADGGKPSQRDALKSILIGWVITLPVAALIAALSARMFLNW